MKRRPTIAVAALALTVAATTATVSRIDKHSTGFDRLIVVPAQGLRLTAKAPAAVWVTLDCIR